MHVACHSCVRLDSRRVRRFFLQKNIEMEFLGRGPQNADCTERGQGMPLSNAPPITP